ncbi:hypothetical protein F5X68DRAFT_178203 [Plectosphaerella plurivora]|uniref:Uncharacterized protein n=1 Tax=Plectosphaerella plurivora TaxID=936078 RepID=A0A9P9A4M3_9PEZI|nr:hypothetical protein F5X68DRAFT_178203 [Plectosphaerella plurivora]
MYDNATCHHDVWDVIRSNRENQTALNTMLAPAWVETTELRSTFSIIQTCLLTLVACIYSALHLDVPRRTDFWYRFGVRMLWVALALFAPEIVVYVAIDQFYDARTLSQELRQRQTEAAEGSVDKSFNFDIKYAFFILMGGVSVPRSRLDGYLSRIDFNNVTWSLFSHTDGVPRADVPTLHLTSSGVLDISRFGHWIYVDPKQIRDRSKADGIQKSLILLQVSWMLVSCISRKAYGLPLTLIEIHTMVHIVCAFTMFIFWFKKPVDIQEEEFYDFPTSWGDAIALLCQKTFYNNGQTIHFRQQQKHAEDGDSHIDTHKGCSDMGSRNLGTLNCQDTTTDIHVDVRGLYDSSNHLFRYDPGSPAGHEGMRITTNRWHAVIRALQTLGVPLDNMDAEVDSNQHAAFHPPDIIGTVTKSGRHSSARVITFATILLPAAYGGIHLTAWSSSFPTPAEGLLWRVSCIGIMTTIPAIASLVVPIKFAIIPIEKTNTGMLIELFLWAIGLVSLLFYAFCRIFIVVESFLSLRSVPVGAYWIPAWMQYIPHA